MKFNPKIVPLFSILAGIMWGSIGIFVRHLTAAGMDNGTIVFARMSVSALILAIFILVTKPSNLKVPLKAIPLILVGGIVGSAYMNIVYNIAILSLNLALSSVLIGLFALWAIFLGRIFFGEHISLNKLICCVVALAGVTLVAGVFEQTDFRTLSYFGLGMGFLTGIMYAVNGVTTRVMSDWQMPASTINFWYFLVGAISLIPLCDFSQIASFVSAAPVSGILWLIAQALVCAILPYVLFTLALGNMDMGRASILELIEPAWAMLIGFLLYGEVPTVLMIVGVVIVVGAISKTYLEPFPEPEPEPAATE